MMIAAGSEGPLPRESGAGRQTRDMSKLRVLVLLSTYPTLSQTYKENELRALLPYCELRVLSIGGSDHMHRDHLPYAAIKSFEQARAEIETFKPDVIHGHYVHLAKRTAELARAAKRPFTIRTHSFDIINRPLEKLAPFVPFMNAANCLGVLVFPFLRKRLSEAGIDESKLHDCWPVVDFARFYDPSPNGEEVLNTGACLPKKNMRSYVRLAHMVPERQFNLYPIGYLTEGIHQYNRKLGSPVKIHETVEPYDMPAVYKRHQWLVYSANRKVPTIGWPMAIAEAQASGVGVLIQRIRPDIETYVGGAGFVFDELEEAAEILKGPCPPDIREAGFRQARRSDVSEHIRLLLDLWSGAASRPVVLAPPPPALEMAEAH